MDLTCANRASDGSIGLISKFATWGRKIEPKVPRQYWNHLKVVHENRLPICIMSRNKLNRASVSNANWFGQSNFIDPDPNPNPNIDWISNNMTTNNKCPAFVLYCGDDNLMSSLCMNGIKKVLPTTISFRVPFFPKIMLIFPTKKEKTCVCTPARHSICFKMLIHLNLGPVQITGCP